VLCHMCEDSLTYGRETEGGPGGLSHRCGTETQPAFASLSAQSCEMKTRLLQQGWICKTIKTDSS